MEKQILLLVFYIMAATLRLVSGNNADHEEIAPDREGKVTRVLHHLQKQSRRSNALLKTVAKRGKFKKPFCYGYLNRFTPPC